MIGARHRDRYVQFTDGKIQRKHRPDYWLVLCAALLMLVGMIIVYSVGPQYANLQNSAYGSDYSSTYFFFKQLMGISLAVSGFVLLILVPFDYLKKYIFQLMMIGIGLSFLLFLIGNILHVDAIAQNTLGAYRWFHLGPVNFQPSELLKLAMTLYMAVFLGKRYQEGKINDLKETVYPAAALVGFLLFIVVVLQKDMGSGVAIAAAAASIFMVSTIRMKTLMQIALVGLLFLGLTAVTAPHRLERITTFFGASKSASQDDNDYHIKNAMIALGTGGLTGRGIGKSIQSTGYLPEAINDSIFAVIGEIFGFAGTVLVVVLFAVLLLRVLRVAEYSPDMTRRLVVAGIFGWLFAHFFMNIASMIHLAPLTGITLPFLSAGGSSMLFSGAALGIVFQLSRYTAHKPIDIGGQDADISRRRRLGGSRYSSRRRVARS